MDQNWAFEPAPKHGVHSHLGARELRPVVVASVVGAAILTAILANCVFHAGAVTASPVGFAIEAPVPTGPLPTPTAAPMPTGPLPTPTAAPLPTPTGPLPTPTAAPLPTPTGPLPTPTAAPLPTPTGPLPTPTAAPLPTPVPGPRQASTEAPQNAPAPSRNRGLFPPGCCPHGYSRCNKPMRRLSANRKSPKPVASQSNEAISRCVMLGNLYVIVWSIEIW